MIRKFIQYLRLRVNTARYISWLKEGIDEARSARDDEIKFYQQEAISQERQRISIELELEQFRSRLNKMHRRAQRAEASRNKAFMEMAETYRGEIEGTQTAYLSVSNRLFLQRELFFELYQYLHSAWLHHAGSAPVHDNIKANAIVSIEARLRAAFPGITEPPKPEVFHSGKPEDRT